MGKQRKHKQEPELVTTTKQRSALDAVNRIMWDPALPTDAFLIGYLDRFVGIVEKPVSAFNFQQDISTLSHLEFAIPQHRIQYIKYKDYFVWDKREESRVDRIFGSYGAANLELIEELVARDPYVEEAQGEEEVKEREPVAEPVARSPADRPNFFICCRVLSPKVKNFAENMQYGSDEGMYEGRLDTERLHFTLLTLRLRNEMELERAKEALHDFEIPIDAEQPLHVKGVGSFRGRVVYAGVDESDGISYESFVLLHERLRNHMIARLGHKSWVGQTVNQFTPHMTISKVSRPMMRAGKHISEISYVKHRDTPIGYVRVHAIHLCKMEPPKLPSAFYETHATKLNNVSPMLTWLGQQELPAMDGNWLEHEKQLMRLRKKLKEKSVTSNNVTCRQLILSNDDSCHDDSQALVICSDDHDAFLNAVIDRTPLIQLQFRDMVDLNLHKDFAQKFGGYEIVEDTNLPSSTKTAKPSSLYVFDLDHTLLITPDQDPKNRYSKGLWLTMPDSLDKATITTGPALKSFHRVVDRKSCDVVIISGRKESLRPELTKLLATDWSVVPKMMILKRNPMVSTSKYKANALRDLVSKRHNTYDLVHIFEDDYDALMAYEGVLEELDIKYKLTHVKNDEKTDDRAQRFDVLLGWLEERLRSWLGTCTHDTSGLVIPFGSYPLGRTGGDVDLCILAPKMGSSSNDTLEKFYQIIRSQNVDGSKVPEGFKLIASHLAKRARCPRISLCFSFDDEEFEIDVVMATFPQAVFPPSTDASVGELMALCEDGDEASVKALSGLLLLEEIKQVLGNASLSIERFGDMLNRVIDFLERRGLRGSHFQMIKTFQVVLLLESFIKEGGGVGKQFTFHGFASYVGKTLARDKWRDILRGIYHDNKDDFASCNLIYMDRLIKAFEEEVEKEAHGGQYNFEAFCAENNLRIIAVKVVTKNYWKTKTALEASFPGYLRFLLANEHMVYPNATRPGLVFCKEDNSFTIEMGVTFEGSRSEKLLHDGLQRFLLPPQTSCRITY